jgi:hypothetical protein
MKHKDILWPFYMHAPITQGKKTKWNRGILSTSRAFSNPYDTHFGVKNGDIESKNTCFWDVKV